MEGGSLKALYPCGIKKISIKEIVQDSEAPQKITHMKFGLLNPAQMIQLAEFQVVNRELYQLPKRDPMQNGVLDGRLGVSNKTGSCTTCGQKMTECAGHYGYIKLALPVFHIGYIKNIIGLLQIFCKYCSRIKLPDAVRQYYLNEMRTKKEVLHRKALLKHIMDRAKKVRTCPYCGELNGIVQKSGVLKITHEKYKEKKYQPLKSEFLREFEEALKLNDAIVPHIGKAKDDINPLRALQIFQKIPAEDVELVDMDPALGRPENLIFQHLLVPPVTIRPSVTMDAAQGSNEDDLTMGLMKIVGINTAIEQDLEKGADIAQVMEKWDTLQIHTAMYINSDMPGIPPGLAPGKPTRGFCQRLKGKKGRFRGNLSGKRVDFSGRTVISPDPNLKIDEVAVPVLVAMVMTYPEKVFSANINRLRRMVINGPDQHPGANYIINRTDGSKSFLKFGDRTRAAANLRPGDIVERHVIDGDVVLFNRQPSLHRISIMAHRVRVMPWRTFRFNECVCGPYNADFDGDEMNLHVPQTEEARAEAMTLMAVNQNLITPRNGEPLVAAIQDFITASYLMTRKDLFYDRAEFCRVCSFIYDAKTKIDLPPPCILKPIELWTGKQVFNVLMRPNKESKVLVTMEVPGRTYSGKGDYQPRYMCYKDGYVLIKNSELLCGVLDKKTLGGGSKQNLFHVLMRDYSTVEAASCMSKVAKLCARWLADHGFSIGISDVQPSTVLKRKKKDLVDKGYAECDSLIQDFNEGKLPPQPGCNMEETLEAKLSKELSDIRDRAGELCISELHYLNSPLIMALCGSKGSNINISQMIACVGQQTVSGARIPQGFIHRTLPHFPRDSKAPKAKGFVKNSFYSGMTATEFFFHTMGGREGLVDTAVKTAETGYMQRRLMKALEDLSVQYDNTVRNSVGGIVQFVYGDDGLDPTGMEAQEKPVDFQRVLKYIIACFPCPDERPLLPAEIKDRVDKALVSPMFAGGVSHGVREQACSELFIDEVRSFFLGGNKVKGVVDSIIAIRKKYGLALDQDKVVAEGVSKEDARSRILAVHRLNRLTETQMKEFFTLIRHKFKKAEIEPGTAVGALGAQSIGEPGTQMTLKTFHFAGVASMNITLGVPRIKEIINASKDISTPIISATLVNDRDERAARIVKGRIEKTSLGEIAEYIKEVYNPGGCYISVKLDMEAIQALQLEVTAESVRKSILSTPRTKIKEQHVSVRSKSKLWVSPVDTSREQMFFSLQAVKNLLPTVLVRGISTVSRAVINKKKVDGETIYNLLVEGDDLLHVMSTPGVVGTKTTCNHIMEVEKTLGIEAARVTIMNEIQYTMREHGMSIDTRHVMLLADLMCFRGEVLGITRFGIAKMKESVMMLASFEKTTDHLFDASVHARQDEITGVSECIIMGIPIPIGTGLFRLLRKTETPRKLPPTPLMLNRPKRGPLDIATILKDN